MATGNPEKPPRNPQNPRTGTRDDRNKELRKLSRIAREQLEELDAKRGELKRRITELRREMLSASTQPPSPPIADPPPASSLAAQPAFLEIPAWGYLCSVWTLLWSAILHPLSETTIDLMTGKVVSRS